MSDELENKPKPKKVKWAQYIGKGSHLIGTPARNLSFDEWMSIEKGLREHLVEMGLYEVKYD